MAGTMSSDEADELDDELDDVEELGTIIGAGTSGGIESGGGIGGDAATADLELDTMLQMQIVRSEPLLHTVSRP